MMKVYEGIASLMENENVEEVFTLMSDGIMGVVSALQNSESITVTQTRHEQAAVAMADGHSKASDNIGVCVVGRGAALAQTGTALGTAARRGANVLVITAECSLEPPRNSLQHKPDIKRFDQHGLLQNLLGEDHVIDSRSVDAVIPDLEDAFRRLRAGDGPISVQVPFDLFDAEVDVSTPLGGKGLTPVDANPPRRTPSSEKIAAAIDCYLDADASRAPIVLAGKGAADTGAVDAIETFAERINGILVTTLKGRGLFPDHPYSPGFVGSWGSNLANEYLTESDCIFAFGCSLNPFTLDAGHLRSSDASVVHVDVDSRSIGRYSPVDVGIVGGAQETAELLVAALEEEGIDREGTFWTDSLRREITNDSAFEPRTFPERAGTIDPRVLINHLNDSLPEERFVVSDGGHCMRWVLGGIDITDPDDYTWTIDFGAIGQGLCQGIGASQTLNRRTCLTFCGDAGFLMHLSEVETAARSNAPMFIVVFNDGALGEEYHNLTDKGLDPDGALIPTANLSDVATALGAEAYSITSESDLDAISDRLTEKPDGPVILDCQVNIDVRHRTAGL